MLVALLGGVQKAGTRQSPLVVVLQGAADDRCSFRGSSSRLQQRGDPDRPHLDFVITRADLRRGTRTLTGGS